MKRSLQSGGRQPALLVGSATALIAATYGLTRLGYGLALPDMQRDLRLPAQTAGLLASGGSISYCVAAALALLGVRRHPRVVALGAGLLAAAGTAGMAAAPGPTTFAVAAIIAPAGAGLASPAAVALVHRNTTAERRDTAQSIVNAGTGPGLVAAGASALLVLPDWRAAWWITTAVTIAVTASTLLADRPDGTAPPASGKNRPTLRHLAAPAAGALLLGTGSAAIWVFGRTFLATESGMTPRASILAWIALGAGGLLAALTSTRSLARGISRAWTGTVTATAAATAVLALAPDAAWVIYAACVTFGWGFTAATSVLIVWAARLAPAAAAPGTSVLFIALVLGQAVGSTAVGAITTAASARLAFAAAAAVCLTGLAPALLGARPRTGVLKP